MDFHGFSVGSLSNAQIHLDFLTQGALRLVRLFVRDSAAAHNLLAEMPQMSTSTPFGTYRFFGGHRLWHSPEIFPRTVAPDPETIEVEEIPGGVRLVQSVEPATGIRKSMEVRLDPNRSVIRITHTMQNSGLWAAELAPWAITMLTLGGTAVLPLPHHPDGAGLLPDRNLVFWPYTHLNDARIKLEDDFVLVHADAQKAALKIGMTNTHGWVAYLYEDILFVKRFEPQAHLPHTDFGANVECYSENAFIELETLGSLARLEPDQSVSHSETWEVITGVQYTRDQGRIRELLQDLNFLSKESKS